MAVAPLTVADGLAHIELSRPESLNAIDRAMKAELADHLRELHRRDDVRALLLTGAGRGFCAGGDIVDMEPDLGPEVQRRRLVRLMEDIVVPLARLPVPTVAGVHGIAAGLGLGLALACDVVVCGRGAKLTTAFAKVGLASDGGATWFLPRLVGAARAKELMLTGRVVSGEEAFAIGLVARLADDEAVHGDARALATELATGPTVALGTLKRLLDRSPDLSLDDLGQLEAYGQAVAMTSDDYHEGVDAFRARRSPGYRGT